MSDAWRTRTRLVHGGSRRSAFGETSEALFLTSGFRYARAEDAVVFIFQLPATIGVRAIVTLRISAGGRRSPAPSA